MATMQAETFAEAYPRDISIETKDVHADILREPREWSQTFGTILHDYLSGEELTPAETLGNTLQRYYAWNTYSMPKIINKLHASTDFEDHDQAHTFWRAMNELNFHALSGAMLPMWMRLTDDPSKVRAGLDAHSDKNKLDFCQLDLATRSLSFGGQRHGSSTIKEDYAYFGNDWREFRKSMEGMVSEYDTGIVLLEMCKSNRNLIAIPGPKQFEDKNPALNSDFIIIDTSTREVTGVQTKGAVTPEDIARYNPHYVTLIDGRVDLGNVRHHRVAKGSSKELLVSWPGMISAGFIVDLPAHGPRMNSLKKHLPMSYLMQQKLAARHELGSAKPELKQAVKKLSDRILPRLMQATVEIA